MTTVNIPVHLSEMAVGLFTILATLEEIDEEAGIHLTKYMSNEASEAIDHLLQLKLIEELSVGDTIVTRGRHAGQSRNDGVPLFRITELGKQLITIMETKSTNQVPV